MKKLGLSQKIIIGSVLGIITGFILGPNASYLKFIGDIFLRLIKMCVPLLIFCSIVHSTGSLDIKDLGKLGSRTLITFVTSTTVAALLAVSSVILVKPTITLEGLNNIEGYGGYIPTGNFLDVLVNFIPENIFRSFTEGTIIQIIVFGCLFGISLSLLGKEKGTQSLLNAVISIRKVMMKIITLSMAFAPIGIFAMLADIIGSTGSAVLGSLAQVVIMVTVVDIIFFVLFTLFVCVKCKLSLPMLLKNISRIAAMSTTTVSAAMTLPTALIDTNKRIGVSEKITNFILPLGNAINTNGAPISNIISAVTCAYMFNIQLSPQNYILMTIYAILSSFGNPGVPGGGIVSLAVVFQMVGLPMEGIAIFAGLDYFYSLTRATLNVMGSVYASIIVADKNDELDRTVFMSANANDPLSL